MKEVPRLLNYDLGEPSVLPFARSNKNKRDSNLAKFAQLAKELNYHRATAAYDAILAKHINSKTCIVSGHWADRWLAV